MALGKSLILRRPWSGRLEGRRALIQLIVNSFTRSFAGVTKYALGPSRLPHRRRIEILPPKPGERGSG